MKCRSIYGKEWEWSAPRMKITDEQVREIRASTASRKELAHKYGVNPSTISSIRLGRYRRGVK